MPTIWAARSKPGIHDAILRPPRNRAWAEAWQVTEALIAQMNAEVRARSKRFLLATLTIGIQVHPDASRAQRR